MLDNTLTINNDINQYQKIHKGEHMNEFEKNNTEFLLSLKAKSLRQEREAEESLLDSLELRDQSGFRAKIQQGGG